MIRGLFVEKKNDMLKLADQYLLDEGTVNCITKYSEEKAGVLRKKVHGHKFSYSASIHMHSFVCIISRIYLFILRSCLQREEEEGREGRRDGGRESERERTTLSCITSQVASVVSAGSG